MSLLVMKGADRYVKVNYEVSGKIFLFYILLVRVFLAAFMKM